MQHCFRWGGDRRSCRRARRRTSLQGCCFLQSSPVCVCVCMCVYTCVRVVWCANFPLFQNLMARYIDRTVSTTCAFERSANSSQVCVLAHLFWCILVSTWIWSLCRYERGQATTQRTKPQTKRFRTKTSCSKRLWRRPRLPSMSWWLWSKRRRWIAPSTSSRLPERNYPKVGILLHFPIKADPIFCCWISCLQIWRNMPTRLQLPLMASKTATQSSRMSVLPLMPKTRCTVSLCSMHISSKVRTLLPLWSHSSVQIKSVVNAEDDACNYSPFLNVFAW